MQTLGPLCVRPRREEEGDATTTLADFPGLVTDKLAKFCDTKMDAGRASPHTSDNSAAACPRGANDAPHNARSNHDAAQTSDQHVNNARNASTASDFVRPPPQHTEPAAVSSGSGSGSSTAATQEGSEKGSVPVAMSQTSDATMRQRLATREAVRAALLLWAWVDLRCRAFGATVGSLPSWSTLPHVALFWLCFLLVSRDSWAPSHSGEACVRV